MSVEVLLILCGSTFLDAPVTLWLFAMEPRAYGVRNAKPARPGSCFHPVRRWLFIGSANALWILNSDPCRFVLRAVVLENDTGTGSSFASEGISDGDMLSNRKSERLNSSKKILKITVGQK